VLEVPARPGPPAAPPLAGRRGGRMSQEHLSMELLLAVRDGERSEPEQVAAHAHVASCEACRAELDRLHQRTAMLRALPTLTPARNAFPAVQRQLAEDLRPRRQLRFTLGAQADAAALALAGDGITPAPQA